MSLGVKERVALSSSLVQGTSTLVAGIFRSYRQADSCHLANTSAYRAPELLFGSRSYDPFALDRWSLGCCIATFFTPLALEHSSSPDSSEDGQDSSDEFGKPPRPPWMRKAKGKQESPLRRADLFEGGHSDFALIGSIFRTLGTPTLESWPEAASLPDYGKFTYKSFTPRDLRDLLPNMPSSSGAHGASCPADLVSRFLRYPYGERLSASEALRHAYLSSEDPPLLLPADFAAEGQKDWDGESLGAYVEELGLHW